MMDFLTTKQISDIEQAAYRDERFSESVLMQNAGRACLRVALDVWPNLKKVAVFCGPGNNAGDGYVFASEAVSKGISVTVYSLIDPEKFSDNSSSAAKQAYTTVKKNNVVVKHVTQKNLPGIFAKFDADLIVDAIVGSGLSRPIEGLFREVFVAINQLDVPVLSVDVPSGVDANTGEVLGAAIMADVTVTMIAAKRGLVTGEVVDYVGELIVDQIGLPDDIITDRRGGPDSEGDEPQELSVDADQGVNKGEAVVRAISLDACLEKWPSRLRSAHKGDCGHVLVIGGNDGMPGAVRIAAEAALRIGAGLVTVATKTVHVSAVVSGRPEIMCYGVDDVDAIDALLARATVVVIGPGLGVQLPTEESGWLGPGWAGSGQIKSTWGARLMEKALCFEGPMLIDADGLNYLATVPSVWQSQDTSNWVLTPHPGEAARLLSAKMHDNKTITATDVNRDRFDAIEKLQSQYGGTIVLKGAGSLIRSLGDETTHVCLSGNPGMASGGMGDCLSGMIAGLMAQGLSCEQAAKLGVELHAQCGDLACIDKGEAGILALDLLPYLSRFL